MKLFKLGFTGTQQGMTTYQKALLVKHLERLAKKHENFEIHHGDCIGADEEFHKTCLATLPDRVTVVLHPPINAYKRAFCTSPRQIERIAEDFLKRNRSIVDEIDGIFAAPKEIEEQLRSGTWATVRYARKCQKPLVLLPPEK